MLKLLTIITLTCVYTSYDKLSVSCTNSDDDNAPDDGHLFETDGYMCVTLCSVNNPCQENSGVRGMRTKCLTFFKVPADQVTDEVISSGESDSLCTYDPSNENALEHAKYFNTNHYIPAGFVSYLDIKEGNGVLPLETRLVVI